MVLLCEKRGCTLADLTLDDLKAESDLFKADVARVLDLRSIAAARTTYGGTGNEAVKVQLGEAEAAFQADAAKLQ